MTYLTFVIFLQPVRIKVTPLRPLFGKYSRTRGLPGTSECYCVPGSVLLT
jgi:hypothetical protein